MAEWALRVNGAELTPAAALDVVSMRTEEQLGAIGMLTVELKNWDAATLTHTWSDDSLFAIGNELELARDPAARAGKFIGEVVAIEPRWAPGSAPRVTIRAYDHLHRLGRGTRSRTFVQLKDSAIAAQIARGAGLRAEVTDTKVTLPYVLQSNQSDLDFLRTRAARYGYEFFVRDKTLHFRVPPAGEQPAHTLTVGEDLDEFNASLDASDLHGTHQVRGWDPKTKKEVLGSHEASRLSFPGAGRAGAGTADKAFGRSTVTTTTALVRTKAEADAFALGRLTEVAAGYVEADAEGPGVPGLVPGRTVQIEGAGQRFGGRYYVVRAGHSLDGEHRYRTTLRLRKGLA